MAMKPCQSCGTPANPALSSCPQCGLINFASIQPTQTAMYSKCNSCGQVVPWRTPPPVCPNSACHQVAPLRAQYRLLRPERVAVVFLKRNWFWLIPLWGNIILAWWLTGSPNLWLFLIWTAVFFGTKRLAKNRFSLVEKEPTLAQQPAVDLPSRLTLSGIGVLAAFFSYNTIQVSRHNSAVPTPNLPACSSITYTGELQIDPDGLWPLPIEQDKPMVSAEEYAIGNRRLRNLYKIPADPETDRADIITIQVVNGLDFNNHLKDPEKGPFEPGNDTFPQGAVRWRNFCIVSRDNYDACVRMIQDAREQSAQIKEGPTNVEVGAICHLIDRNGNTPSLPAFGLPSLVGNVGVATPLALVDAKTHEAFALRQYDRNKTALDSFLKHAFIEGMPVLAAQAAVDKEDLAFLRAKGTPCAPAINRTP